jgi:hypothetical protein
MEVGLVEVNMEPTWSASGLGAGGERFAMLPYSVGLLQAYAQRHAANALELSFRPAVFSRISVEDAVAQLDGCDVAGFSLYVWNERISLAIAQELKRRRADLRTVFAVLRSRTGLRPGCGAIRQSTSLATAQARRPSRGSSRASPSRRSPASAS